MKTTQYTAAMRKKRTIADGDAKGSNRLQAGLSDRPQRTGGKGEEADFG